MLTTEVQVVIGTYTEKGENPSQRSKYFDPSVLIVRNKDTLKKHFIWVQLVFRCRLMGLFTKYPQSRSVLSLFGVMS